MKRLFFTLLCILFPLSFATACGEKDYSDYLSEVRSDLFYAQADGFSVTVACVEREYPYLADGIACTKNKVVEITLKDEGNATDYRVFLEGERKIGGELSFRNVRGDFFFSQGVETFPKESVTLTVEWEENSCSLVATSVKNSNTLSANKALSLAISSEQELVNKLEESGTFCGEIHLRLLRREKNYYYVGIIDRKGNTTSLLLDGESGEILARRLP